MDLGMTPEDLADASGWDIAIRYHELKAKLGRQNRRSETQTYRRISASAILEKARTVLGSVVHPSDMQSAPLSEMPGAAEQPDFDIDETIENSPLSMSEAAGVLSSKAHSFPLTDADIWMSYRVHRRQAIVLSVDTSLSMTGEKLALTAVALAVVLLQFPEDPIGIVAFENTATILKRPHERISLQELVERFIDVPAQGYTHLEDGMKQALSLIKTLDTGLSSGRPPSTVLLTDGKYTAGRDPAYLAPRFAHLVVMKMGKERASRQLCNELANKGHGALREVTELEALPYVMYGVVKDLLRGTS